MSKESRKARAIGWRPRILGDGQGNTYRDWYYEIGPEPGKTLFAKTAKDALRKRIPRSLQGEGEGAQAEGERP